MLSRTSTIVTIHDACPYLSEGIFTIADAFEDMNIKYNIGLIPFFNEREYLPRYPDFVDKLKSYHNAEIVLHGLYHERKNRELDDFHTRTKIVTEEELRVGKEILQEVGIITTVFIPPSWRLNLATIAVLEKLGFTLAETQEQFILLSKDTFRKITVPKVLSWDSCADPDGNIVNLVKMKSRFKRELKEEIKYADIFMRIAPHPRDPPHALADQKEMIRLLQEEGYKMLQYKDLIPKLLVC